MKTSQEKIIKLTAQELWAKLSIAQRAMITLWVDIGARPTMFNTIKNNDYEGLMNAYSMENWWVKAAETDQLDGTDWLGKRIMQKINAFVEGANFGVDEPASSIFARLFTRCS